MLAGQVDALVDLISSLTTANQIAKATEFVATLEVSAQQSLFPVVAQQIKLLGDIPNSSGPVMRGDGVFTPDNQELNYT